jgi:hypothetical protein
MQILLVESEGFKLTTDLELFTVQIICLPRVTVLGELKKTPRNS